MSLWVSLRSLLGPLEVLLEASGSKNIKKLRVFKVFENAAFWLFEAPDGSLGLILPPLWPIWSQNGPQRIPKTAQKAYPNLTIHFFVVFFQGLFLASKTSELRPVRAIFFQYPALFFCPFLGALFDLFLTNFWTTFGCLFGCLLGAFSGLLRFSWEASGSKNTKKLKVFLGF